MGFVSFTDSIGAAQLDNGMTAIAGGVGSRFRNWISRTIPIGVEGTSLGTGARSTFVFRTDYMASFQMQDIPNANVAKLDRLIAFLLKGGLVNVDTGDSGGNAYASCCLAEGTTPEKTLFNGNDITWQLSVTLVNLSAAPMTCLYSS